MTKQFTAATIQFYRGRPVNLWMTETMRQWCAKFGPEYARRLKRRQGRLSDTWFLDEVFVAINAQQQYLWRAATRTVT